MELNIRLFFAIVFLRLNQMLIVNIIFYVIQLIVSWSFDSSITESQNLCFIAYTSGWMRTSVSGRGRTSSLFPRDQPSPCPSKNQENFLHSLAAGSSRLVFYASSISILNQKKSMAICVGHTSWSTEGTIANVKRLRLKVQAPRVPSLHKNEGNGIFVEIINPFPCISSISKVWLVIFCR